MSYQTLPRRLYEVAADDVAYDLIRSAGTTGRGTYHESLVALCHEYLSGAALVELGLAIETDSTGEVEG